MASCARVTGLAMRISVAIFLLVGIALIVFGCVVQNPPKKFAAAMFVVVGSLNIFGSLLGLWGSYHKHRILLLFLAVGGLSVILQIAFDIALLVAFDKCVDAIAPLPPPYPPSPPPAPPSAPAAAFSPPPPPSPPSTYDADVASHDKVAKDLNIARWVFIGFIFLEIVTLVLAVLMKWVIKEEDNRYKGFGE